MHPEFSNIEALIFGLCYCAFMLVLGIIFLKFPPKEINSLYGYRTTRSMKTQEIWEAANAFWTKLFIKLNLISFTIPIVTYFIYPQQLVLITIIVSTVLLLVTIPITEKFLKTNFDKEGNRI